jgi:hypothetical protein
VTLRLPQGASEDDSGCREETSKSSHSLIPIRFEAGHGLLPNFRPQAILLPDRGEAFVFVELTSAPSPTSKYSAVLQVVRYALGLH